ncbi:hypothetical protein [Algoriphagus marinus]|uniref:hypothetical protein n=1 Tax=Algoriphagus marinus TaxID=1925762 RepID=UPI0015880C48|nr:hypothetical protein [Algoriphagus marinus]
MVKLIQAYSSFFWLGPKEPKTQDMEMLLPACHRRPASMSTHRTLKMKHCRNLRLRPSMKYSAPKVNVDCSSKVYG